ncbi:unnamed protein product [Rodentolepis nana]|uniref:Caprin-1_dimer domain-containing protein n=1 Tax=Rodentolepis nana TaxID=102285 RepID=A0A0R3TW80_RODNA|nr:unnamed protein product [Rodentolepis nana]
MIGTVMASRIDSPSNFANLIAKLLVMSLLYQTICMDKMLGFRGLPDRDEKLSEDNEILKTVMTVQSQKCSAELKFKKHVKDLLLKRDIFIRNRILRAELVIGEKKKEVETVRELLKECIRKDNLRKAKRKQALMETFIGEMARLEDLREHKLHEDIFENVILAILDFSLSIINYRNFAKYLFPKWIIRLLKHLFINEKQLNLGCEYLKEIMYNDYNNLRGEWTEDALGNADEPEEEKCSAPFSIQRGSKIDLNEVIKAIDVSKFLRYHSGIFNSTPIQVPSAAICDRLNYEYILEFAPEPRVRESTSCTKALHEGPALAL